eukprot:GILJ01002469.1.p1 GENE.GILJ01002469.1~~GILJ01002469.1.p1  ORF type:complete len:276 (+),score=38.91 GILJ01002469.1:58-885(+)
MSYSYETLSVSNPHEFVFHVEFNRPKKLNAMNQKLWTEVGDVFAKLSEDPNCRVIVTSGSGRLFTAGLDLSEAAEAITLSDITDVGRKGYALMKLIKQFQACFTAIEQCHKPVIAAVHNACIGGGVDYICACDIRVCSADAFFSIKEIDIGMAADIGTLQRLPKIVGNESKVRELVYTGRRMKADEAKEFGLVSTVYADKETMMREVMALAVEVSQKSPIAVTGSKMALNYARDHSVEDSLKQIMTWNMSMLQSEDMMQAVSANLTKQKPLFSKL